MPSHKKKLATAAAAVALSAGLQGPAPATAQPVAGPTTSLKAQQAMESRWRDAALSGQFERIRDTLNEMVSTNWPEHDGHVYVREYGKPGEPSVEDDRTAYADFVVGLYDKKFAGSSSPEEADFNREILREQAISSYDQNINKKAPLGTEGAEDMGIAIQQDFSYEQANADGTYEKKSFRVAVVNLNASDCKNCETNVAVRRADPSGCDLITPDEVLKDRMAYFNTATHELAHGIRILNNELIYETLDDKRYEENVAMVFAAQMDAKVFGTMGMLQMRQDVTYSRPLENELGYRYEATVPMQTALAKIDSERGAITSQKPRDLLKHTEKLVFDTDPTRDMTGAQWHAYSNFVMYADRSADAVLARLQTAGRPNEVFNALVVSEPLNPNSHSVQMQFPYQGAVVNLDKIYERADVLNTALSNTLMRLNPLRGPAMRRVNTELGLPEWSNPAIANELKNFNAAFNHPSCDIPALIAVRVEIEQDDAAMKLEPVAPRTLANQQPDTRIQTVRNETPKP